ncbi:TauD/TfdA family dioxygenase [Nocardia spumae]|uniref:TauD/TfdA family dioxygenase n=1 Tax=Nocardia spumae TaxID=2887190 RepID=UPI001D140BE4|nr:TauD/TfdA family dioxygenase [Nocardia spumae]
MKNVLRERKTPHDRDYETIDRRTLPEEAAAAVLCSAREIAITLDHGRAPTAELPRTLTDPMLIRLIDTYAAELPAAVRIALRPPETAAGATIIGTLPVRDAELGDTPRDWRRAADSARPGSFHLDIAMLLLARCGGEPFGWQGQQGGRLVNNILPTPGHEDEQSGASSTTLLSPHTEDAFHPERAHLLLLGCLRNPDRVGTTISSVRQVRLDPERLHRLTEPTLPILPDVSYGADFGDHRPASVATIGSGDEGPTLRYDPAYTPLDEADPEYRCAYTDLGTELARVCHGAVLAPGELLLMDNDVVVHGRVPFSPRYDGTDRWLKRVNIRLTRRRATAEADESGYGQRTVRPFQPKPAGEPDISNRRTDQ